jgi:hypothetical protein
MGGSLSYSDDYNFRIAYRIKKWRKPKILVQTIGIKTNGENRKFLAETFVLGEAACVCTYINVNAPF